MSGLKRGASWIVMKKWGGIEDDAAIRISMETLGINQEAEEH